MEVDKPEDSSTGDTPEAVVEPAVPVIPDASAGAVQEAEVPASSPVNAGAPQEAEVPAPSKPEVWGDEKTHYCGFDFKTTIHVPPQDPTEPVAGPSQRKSFLRRRLVEDEYNQRLRNRRGTPAPKPQAPVRPEPVICEETIDISSDTTDPDPQVSAEPKPGTSKTIDTSDGTSAPDPQASESKMPECPQFIFMDYMGPLLECLIGKKQEFITNLSPPRSESPELIELCEKMQRSILPDDHWDESREPERAEPASVEEVSDPGTSRQSLPTKPIMGWHSLMNPTYHEVADSSRPTTPTVEDKSPISDLMFLDEDALLEPPTETLTEASLQQVSAMDTSKPSSPSSGTSKRSPPASIDDVSKDTSYTIDTLKPSPPASTDTSKISPPASVDVSKDKTAMDEDAQLEPPSGTLQDEDAQLEPPTGKSTVLGIEAPSGFLARLSPMVQSPQRSPQRVPGVSKLSAAAASRDGTKPQTTSLVPLGTSRKRLLERDEDDEPPTVYRAIDESDETVEYETRRTLATVLSELDEVSRQSSAAALQDASRQSSLSAASMTMSREESLTKAVARQVVADVISQVEEPSSEGVTSMDTSKPSSRTSMDDASKGTTSTFDEDLYLQPDALAGDGEAEEDLTLYKTLLENEAKAGIVRRGSRRQDDSRQSSLSAASMAMAGEESLTKAVAQQAPADVISQVEEPSSEGVASVDTSKLSSQASMDDASKGTTSTFDEDLYLQPDALAGDGEAEEGLSLYQQMLANEANAGILPRGSGRGEVGSPEAMEVDEAAQPPVGAPEVLVGVAAQPVPVGSPQPGPSGMHVGSPQPGPSRMNVDSPQPGPSGLSTQRDRPVYESSDECSQSNESPSDLTRSRKTLKLIDTRMYLSSRPDEEVGQVNTLMEFTTDALQVLDSGNAPFRFFVELFGDIISNQYLMFEFVKASERDRPRLNSELENQCKVNYMTMLKIERLIKYYMEEEGLNRYLLNVLRYILATVHELDAFNHALYRYRGFTSLHNKTLAERIWKHVLKLKEKNISYQIRKKKNESSVSELLNNHENSRLQSGFYEDFYKSYKALRDFMQYLRRKYMPEGVVFSMDDLPGLRHVKDHFTMELAVVLPADMLVTFLAQDVVNQRVVMDRSTMIEYVRLYVSRLFQTEDNFNKLFRELVNKVPTRQKNEDKEDKDNPGVQALKNVLFSDYKMFVDELKKIGVFNFLIEEILDVLAKSLDLLLCMNKFVEKLEAIKQNLSQVVRGGPEETEHRRQFDECAAEIQCVVKSLQEYVFKKILIMQVKLKRIKNDKFGKVFNGFVDLLRTKIHELDCINTDKTIYQSLKYISYTGKISNDTWVEKVNYVQQHLKSRYRIPQANLPEAERAFIQKQYKLYSDNTYHEAVRLLLALCTAVCTLEVHFKIKFKEIISYTSESVDDDAGPAAVAANVADAAVDVPAVAVEEAAVVAVDVAAAAIDVADAAAAAIDVADAAAAAIDVADAAAAAVDVADAAAAAVDVADAAAAAVDVADAAATAVDVTDAAAAVVDVADATVAVVDAVADVADVTAPAVGKVGGAVDVTDAPAATVDIADSSAADKTEDL